MLDSYWSAVAEELRVRGVAGSLLGALLVLAGAGVLLRKRWGQFLAITLAGLVALCGLAALSVGDRPAPALVFGAVAVCYGLLAGITLIVKHADFSGGRQEESGVELKPTGAEPIYGH